MTAEHEKWEELAVGHVLSALEPEDDERFTRHLRGCAACERTITEMTSVASHLAYAAEPADPPAGLKDSILAAVAMSERPPAPGQRGAVRALPDLPRLAQIRAERHVPAWTRLLSAAAGVVLVAGLAIWNVNLRSNVELSQRTVARMERVQDLAADPTTVRVPMNSGSGAGGTALVRGTDVVLLVDGLPRNEPSSIYVIWYQDTTGGFHAVDTFDVREDDHVNVVESELDRTIDRIAAIAISREPGRVAPTTPSAPLIQGATKTTRA